jgi:hypothetical protein
MNTPRPSRRVKRELSIKAPSVPAIVTAPVRWIAQSPPDGAPAKRIRTKKTARPFLSFPYVCPEPVLAKSSFLYINGFQCSTFRCFAFNQHRCFAKTGSGQIRHVSKSQSVRRKTVPFLSVRTVWIQVSVSSIAEGHSAHTNIRDWLRLRAAEIQQNLCSHRLELEACGWHPCRVVYVV